MKALLFGGILFVVVILWCILKVGSDCDDEMGYDNIIEKGDKDES